MSYNLETRVDRLERLKPANPYAHLTDAELEARITSIDERLSDLLGFNTKPMEIAESRMLCEAEARGGESVNAVVDQLRRKCGPPRSGS